MIDEGKLWFVGGGMRAQAVARRECVTREEAVELAKKEHKKGCHFYHNLIKIVLLNRIHTPGLDQSIIKAILDCTRCKNFSGTHLHALLQPITRQHPFELLVGDYLSMPLGKGGFMPAKVFMSDGGKHFKNNKV